jgi:hypothetical protein
MLPYSFAPLSDQRPVITGTSAEEVAMGATLSATYTGVVTHAVIAAPAAVTHQVHARDDLLSCLCVAHLSLSPCSHHTDLHTPPIQYRPT